MKDEIGNKKKIVILTKILNCAVNEFSSNTKLQTLTFLSGVCQATEPIAI
jgi:hypothetical protein